MEASAQIAAGKFAGGESMTYRSCRSKDQRRFAGTFAGEMVQHGENPAYTPSAIARTRWRSRAFWWRRCGGTDPRTTAAAWRGGHRRPVETGNRAISHITLVM
jgi:hypothetical protein